MFKERQNEITQFKSFLNRNGYGAFLVYGDKNVGKSSLVHTACKSVLATKIYLHVESENKDTILRHIRAKCIEAFPNVELPATNDISQLIKFIFENSVNQKIILVIDDLAKLLSVGQEIKAFFLSFKDRFSKYGNIKLVGVTSTYGYNTNNDFFGSFFNELIELKPFNYLTASSFYPTALLDDKISYYAVFGGLPLYNAMIQPQKGFAKNLKDLLLYIDSPLRTKIEGDLHGSFAKKYEADTLLSILAKHQFAHYGELKDEFKMKSPTGDFDYILNKLIEMNVITKKSPLHYEHDKKKFFYAFQDPVYDFFYSHVYENTMSDVLTEEIDRTYETAIKKEFEGSFLPKRILDMSMEFLTREATRGKFKEEVMNIAPYFSDPRTLTCNGTIIVETLSGNFYVMINPSRQTFEGKKIEAFAHSLYEKQRPYKNIVIISRGMFAPNVNRIKYITYRMASLYSKI